MAYRPREMAQRIELALRSMPVVVLTGMRQVGKTTMLREEASLRGRRYFCVDDFPTMEAASRHPASLLRGPDPVTIDEVQRAPDLIREIKVEVDRDRRPGRFLLSGSANLLLMSRVSESLAGRAVYVQLWPMTSREIAGAAGKEPFLASLFETGSPSLTGPDGPRPHPEYPSRKDVATGGMPPVVIAKAEPSIWFTGFEQTYLDRDVRSLAAVADLLEFRRFVRLAAMRTGNLLNMSDLGRDAKVSAATAARYLGILEASFSFFRLPPYLRSLVSRLTKSPKLYVSDSGLAAHLLGSGATVEQSDRHAGAVLETFVAQNLLGIMEAWLPRATLHYWNVHGRHEVDFVIENGDRSVAIEVKWASRWSDHDLAGLRALTAATPACVAALLACNIEESVSLGDRLFAVPLGQLLS